MKVMHIVQCPGGVDRYLSMLLPLLEQYKLYQILVCSYDYDYKKYINEVDKVEQLDMKQSFNLLKLISWGNWKDCLLRITCEDCI